MNTPTELQLGDSCQLTIQSLGYGGMGVARHENGMVCLVGKALPGETVEATVAQLKKRHAVLKLEKIVTASASRVTPPCEHFSDCGGCHLQQLAYDDQLLAKQTVLQDHLNRLKQATPITAEPIVGAEPSLHYRNKNFFHVQGGKIGFINPLTKTLVDVDQCPCAPEKSNGILAEVRKWLANAAGPLKLLLLDCLIRESQSSQDTMIILVVAEEEGMEDLPKATAAATETMRSFEPLRILSKRLPTSSIYITFKPRLSKHSFGDHFLHISGPAQMREQIGPFTLLLSPGSFAQIHPGQAANLYTRLVEELALTGKEEVLDLYSGSGSLAFYLSRACKQVYSIEMNRQSVLDAQASLVVNQIANIDFRTGRCERLLDKLVKQGQRWSVVTLNPPRTGCEPELPALLKKAGAKTIGYVSCSPPTLARDIVTLKSLGYQLKKLAPFDMFPQTYHLEQLALFHLDAGGS